MKKLLLLFLIPILSLTLTGCNDGEDDKPIDLCLFDGVWEVVYQGNQDNFHIGEFLEVSTNNRQIYGGTEGSIMTFFLTATDVVFHDKEYRWNLSEIDHHRPLLKVVYQGDLDSDNQEIEHYEYRIIKLTDKHMWWKFEEKDYSIIKLRRRRDIHLY